MKKVLISTFNRAYNFGALLQSYALQKKLFDMNVDAQHLDYEYNSIDGCFPWGGVKQTIKKLRDYKKTKLFNGFQRKYLCYTEKHYTISELKNLNEDFDYFIVGSDQVWNCRNGLNPIFYFEFVDKEKKKISYAASIGISEIPEEYKSEFKQLVERFDYISVREKTAKELLDRMIDKDICQVLDPVFLLSTESWKKIMKVPKCDEYIFVYGFDISETMKSYINELRNRERKKVISVYSIPGLKVDHVVNLKTGPQEFLGYVYNASYIVTSSFHCAAFSIIFNKKMIVDHHGLTGTRTRDLLELFQYPPAPQLDELVSWINYEIDYDSINKKIDELRESSLKFLEEAIK